MNRRTVKPSAQCSIEGLSFGILSQEETRQMSVLKVFNTVSFNQLGRPLPHGLYDSTMGPASDKESMCLTCSQNTFQCHGHLGHIELPLPVVNPLFRKELSTIIRIVCNKCFRLQVTGIAKQLLLARLKLLDMGFYAAAIDAEQVVANPTLETRDLDVLGEWAKEKLKLYIEGVCKGAVTSEGNKKSRSYESLRRLFVDAAIKTLAKSKTCMYCKQHLQRHFLAQCRFTTTVTNDNIADSDEENEPNLQVSRGRVKSNTATVRPDVLKEYLQQTWVLESDILEVIYPVLQRPDLEFPTDLFFLSTIVVTPPNIRPVNRMLDGTMAEHPQAYSMKMILQDILMIQSVIKAMKEGAEALSEEGKVLLQQMRGIKLAEKLSNCWDELQSDVDHMLDRNLNKTTNGNACFGVKQMIEKKQGLLRMHMMGKRVNFAARSVITPDPNINVDEIGIPEEFAKHLTYPVSVTPWNVEELRKMVINGPKVHPGANVVVSEDGYSSILKDDKPGQRKALAKRLLTPPGHCNQAFSGSKTVHRHLCNGDILLLNRQPTLHRPSIMAHKARILKGEKTIRLHYANCSSYNADFDGDEMNAHFPQNEIARSEGYNLVNVHHQYLVPKNGTPLSGLIQDHVISGVKLTLRGRFFTKAEYQQLVYQSLCSKPGKIRVLPPTIIKPQRLWSGKQIISTVLLNILPSNKKPLSIEDSAKIGARAWEGSNKRISKYGGSPLLHGNDMTEAEVVIRQGELLCGVLDKKHYGATPHGLVHCIYELYGGKYSTLLLSAFSKLFTAFLQTEGFSLGVADILVLKKVDKKRSNVIRNARQIGDSIVTGALEVPMDTPRSQLQQIMKDMFGKDKQKFSTNLDRNYKSALDKVTNEINKLCLPGGLVHTFPENNLQLMVQSGAKGSTVNTMQISCLLGQIELEGKRPPLMISGKSLPSFLPFDTSPRAGGFIDGRFMTGIRPQEFFFHCMAGREGLIDTAVKTSRSGYLQRCLIKHLEGVAVAYDQTVRDSDGSIIQYYYGEDGIDVGKSQFLNEKQIHVLKNNSDVLLNNDEARQLQELNKNTEELEASKKQIRRWRRKNTEKKCIGGFVAFSRDVLPTMPLDQHSDFSMLGRTNRTMATVEAWSELSSKTQQKYADRNIRCPDPVSSQFRLDSCYGALTERLETLIDNIHDEDDKEIVTEIVYQKSMNSQCPAGDPVGILAAQSIGEPSTQMTLNTFHFAGRGDMNVTLGIPRLRELLMTASKNLKTPAMDVPFLPFVSRPKADRLRLHLTRVTVADVLERAKVAEQIDVGLTRQTTYKIKFFFLPHSAYKSQFAVKPKKVLKYMEQKFFKLLENNMKKHMNIKCDAIETHQEKGIRKFKKNDEEEEEIDTPGDQANTMDAQNNMSSDDEQEVDEEAADAYAHREEQEYDDPEEEEVEQESDEENDEEAQEKLETSQNEEENGLPENAEELVDNPDFIDYASRVEDLKAITTYIQSYNYDTEQELWCEVILGVPLDLPKIDMSTVLNETAKKAIIWHIPKINKAFLYKNNNEELMLKVDGINIAEMFKHNKLLDLHKLYTNDIHAFANVYGIEAARRVLVKEVQNVFQVYGITVDPRHLLLIADYMTYNGTYTAMNRGGMADSVSPLQQMSYETCMYFLRGAVLAAKTDYIRSPSSSLITGQTCRVGTGVFDLRLSMRC